MNAEGEARPLATDSTQATGKRVSTIVSRREHKKFADCPHYHGKTGCLIPDLCRQRQIEHCPIRSRWCQEINETDEEYLEYCLTHPAVTV